jgi:hypothetical protein
MINSFTSGDILHLLGGLRSSKAAPLAREFVTHDDSYHRDVALYVLGWMGDDPDIIHGDIEKAKLKTAKFLAELDLG